MGKWWIAFLLLLIGCQNGNVGQNAPDRFQGEVGNGGHGIKQGERVVLYDFWEAGIENGPKSLFHTSALFDIFWNTPHSDGKRRFPSFQRSKRFFRDELQLTFPDKKHQALVEELGDRLAIVFELDPTLALSVLESIRHYQWEFSEDRFHDLSVPGAVHDLSQQEVVLIANRSGRFIYLVQEFWSLMDTWNRAGLVLHEALYSLHRPTQVQLADGSLVWKQDGKRIRQIVSMLSGSRSFSELYRSGLSSFISNDELPMGGAALRDQTTSTHFSRGAKSDNGEPGSFIGEAILRLSSPDLTTTVDLTFPNFESVEADQEFLKIAPEKITPLCSELAKRPLAVVNAELVFSGVQLEFASYQEGNEIKQYLKFSQLSEPRTRGIKSWPSNHFYEAAQTSEEKVKNLAPAEKSMISACQDVLTEKVEYSLRFFPVRY